MKHSIQVCVVCEFILCVLITTKSTYAQVVPDTTLPNNSSVAQRGNTNIINGGTRAGSNLFQSFAQFSVPSNGVAFFNNALDIQNIISRVTGSSLSNIDGLLKANGTANLFLINPNGIIFGPSARLNIGGSFIGSTASNLKFADGTEFSATVPQAKPLLTISVPIGLQFDNNPKSILVKGEGSGRRLVDAPIIDTTVALRVEPDQTLALVGGDLALTGATLKTAGGRIELGSVAGPSLVSLNRTQKGFSLGYESVPTFGNIELSQQATVDASSFGGGDIQVQGRRVTLSNGSQIETSTLGGGAGGTLSLKASESVEVIGRSTNGNFFSGLFAAVYPEATKDGHGGNLTVETRRLFLGDGAIVSSETFGKGIAGNLTVETEQLILRNGAQIASGTFGSGAAGTLTVNASKSVELIGESVDANGSLPSGLFNSVEEGATGAGGNIKIETERLTIRDGAAVTASTYSQENGGNLNGGNITVRAFNSVEVIGKSPSSQDSLSFSRIAALTEGTGNSGNISIETGKLSVRDGARVNVSSEEPGTGNAGIIKIKANRINLDNKGGVTAATASGEGGNILLNAQNLQLRHNSPITASAGGSGNGGNISINTGTLVALENSPIIANAYQGRGGNIQINAQGIFRSPDSPITASSQLGINGTVELNTLINNSGEIVQILPTSTIDATKLVASACDAIAGPNGSKFTVSGTGGFPSSPMDLQSPDEVSADLGSNASSTFVSSAQSSQSSDQLNVIVPSTEIEYHGGPFIEAQGMVRDKNGQVILTAATPTLTPNDIPWLRPTGCQTH